MSQRSVPLAYMISAGNQSVLGLEDYVDHLSEQPEVRAIGLHIEGLSNLPAFERAALRSAKAGKPLVVLKTGASEIGQHLTASHTGSLAGRDDLFNALFDRLGIIRVTSPAQLLETLKFLCVAGVPKGRNVAGFTCSGGGATMLADHADKIGLTFRQPQQHTAETLRELLPDTATVSNPLDYTTPIWGMREKTLPVFRTLVEDSGDTAVIVQDYPAPGLDESKQFYRNDAESFVEATKDIPSAVCSSLPENLDAETRDWLIENGVAPMQGLEETLNAIVHAAWHGTRRTNLPEPRKATDRSPPTSLQTLNEFDGKTLLHNAGFSIPQGICVTGNDAPAAATDIGFPVALKMMGPKLAHKSEAGAVTVNLTSVEAVEAAVDAMRETVDNRMPGAATDHFLVEAMQCAPVCEVFVSLFRDPQFGSVMTLASGGTLVELVGDAATLLLPASRSAIEEAIDSLRVARLMAGYRGQPQADRKAFLNCLEQMVRFFEDNQKLAEIEINPVWLFPRGYCFVDALIHTSD